MALCFHIYMAILTSRLLCSLSHCRLALTVVTFSRSSRIDRPASRNCGRALRSATSHRTAPWPYEFRLQSQPDSRRAWPAGVRTALQTVYRLPRRSFVASAHVSWASAQRWRTCCRSASASKKLRGRAKRRRSRPRQTSRAAIEYFRAQLVLSREQHLAAVLRRDRSPPPN